MSDTPAPDTEDLILGPVLRRVEDGRATVWVEAARPGTVEIRAGDSTASEGTFTAHGHHYGFVLLEGLPPKASTPYSVYLNGEKVWPPVGYNYPPPVIRTRPDEAPVRVLFGSCRESSPLHTADRLPPDALDAYAVRLAAAFDSAGQPPDEWPDLLMLLGDQVYADEVSPTMKRYLDARERGPNAPETQVADFHEYTQLYVDSWTDPDIRWLLSTVPSVMIFDDHEIIDDWNISGAWRHDIAREPWWATRISAGLASYWVYQHLGNLRPDELAGDPVLAAVRASPQDASAVLDAFGRDADARTVPYRWSYAFDLGRTRIVVLDNRAGRQLSEGKRSMLAPEVWDWFDKQVEGDYDHLLVGASLPWLMPPAVHHVEAASERFAESPRPRVRRYAEKMRRAVDLEHWAAFHDAFDALTGVLKRVADRPDGPATVNVLSGDVHHSYVARAELGTRSPVYQLTCSPVHNKLPGFMKPAMRFAWSRFAALMGRGVARAAGLARPDFRWTRLAGPVYLNAISEVYMDGRHARVRIEGTKPDKRLQQEAELTLS
ncbi:alkaline phosphatase D family protein [Virgisporangium aliadipatigenens]|uniref:alkaline phosphatase D family protein n=1 Tax=Virgisporangium aliadipatigenens TaxID=741659 RepID=UPI001EF38E5E|nr:alkaline phosphatase D family protein [Virgisporangium aliadipatigenens]